MREGDQTLCLLLQQCLNWSGNQVHSTLASNPKGAELLLPSDEGPPTATFVEQDKLHVLLFINL